VTRSRCSFWLLVASRGWLDNRRGQAAIQTARSCGQVLGRDGGERLLHVSELCDLVHQRKVTAEVTYQQADGLHAQLGGPAAREQESKLDGNCNRCPFHSLPSGPLEWDFTTF